MKRILLIGDSCTDHYYYGTCERMSPEAPVPIFKHSYCMTYDGMAGNVLRNLQGLGLTCDYVTQTNKITKERYVEERSGQQMLRVDRGEHWPSLAYTAEKYDAMGHYDVVILSDYDKGFITHDFAKYVTSDSRCLVFVDSKKPDLSCFDGAIIKLNEIEKHNAVRFPSKYELIVTLGASGARHNDVLYLADSVGVFDPSGAGDTFFAAFIVSYLQDPTFDSAIKFAMKCARVAVQKPGTYVVQTKDIE